MVSFFVKDHCFGARAPTILVPCLGRRTQAVHVQHSSLILVKERPSLAWYRRKRGGKSVGVVNLLFFCINFAKSSIV